MLSLPSFPASLPSRKRFRVRTPAAWLKRSRSLSAAALLSSAALLLATPSRAQTETPQQQNVPAVPAPDPQAGIPPAALPAPQQTPGNLPDAPVTARPAFDPKTTKKHTTADDIPANQRVVTPAPQPVVAAAPTRQRPFVARNAYDGTPIVTTDRQGSAYIPVDSWMYPALLRLYSLGYLDTAFVSLRPWTRRSTLHMLEQTESDVRFDGIPEAVQLLDALEDALDDEPDAGGTQKRGLVYGIEQAYAGARQVAGPTLRDSWHVGQTFVNDYGRPYSTGFNTYNGFAVTAEDGPVSVYVRGEYQHSPRYTGYTFAQANALSILDEIPYSGSNRPQATIPEGILPSQNNFRILEANLSAHVYGHEISLGKSDGWLGPGLGGAMQWSNNSEGIYSFRINRVEPLRIPFVSSVLGDVRYDFFIGSLKGHTFPNAPWVHSEDFALDLFHQFEISFQRSILFGGEGQQPVTLGTFFDGFFNATDTTASQKFGRDNPGARFSSVTFSWRPPPFKKYVTLYTDSTTHDDIFPLSAPRRAGWRPGIYLPRLPFAPKLDLRVEATYTDYVTSRSTFGQGNYYETIQRQGYTNAGFLLGDWIGREAKGGNATVTYHLSGNEWIAATYLRKKNGKDFIAGGTTQNDYKVELIKRIRPRVELSAWYQHETWNVPFLRSGQQSNDTGSFQVKWYPRLHSTNDLF